MLNEIRYGTFIVRNILITLKKLNKEKHECCNNYSLRNSLLKPARMTHVLPLKNINSNPLNLLGYYKHR